MYFGAESYDYTSQNDCMICLERAIINTRLHWKKIEKKSLMISMKDNEKEMAEVTDKISFYEEMLEFVKEPSPDAGLSAEEKDAKHKAIIESVMKNFNPAIPFSTPPEVIEQMLEVKLQNPKHAWKRQLLPGNMGPTFDFSQIIKGEPGINPNGNLE